MSEIVGLDNLIRANLSPLSHCLLLKNPFVKSLLAGVFGLSEVVDSGKLRFIVIDGSTVQEPGSAATTYRLHIADA